MSAPREAVRPDHLETLSTPRAEPQQAIVSTRPSLFLSYARDDDEAFVRQLYAALTEKGFRVWFDREEMPSRGLSFLQEIREAIDRADRVLVVLGPAAVSSTYVREEWQYALTADKVVTPILRLGGYEMVPAEVKKLHCPDARSSRAWQDVLSEIVRVAQEPPAPLGPLFSVPFPPPHFRPRPDELTRLAELFLLDEPGSLARLAPLRTVVLHGMGGAGKSVLAAAIARSTQTRRLFADGVVWLNFGRDGDLLGALQRAGRALGDDLSGYGTAPEATDRLRARLEQRAVLLVLDNIWHDEHATPLRESLGARCRMLITTRDAGLAARLGAEQVELGVLAEDEALRHLADWVGVDMAGLPPAAREVVRECGRLPFALALAGAMSQGGIGWDDLLRSLREADLEFMKAKFPDYPHTNLLRSLSASLDALRDSTDDDLRDAATRYMEVAAFRWEMPVVENALVTLWMKRGGLDERRARALLSALASKALLRVEGRSSERLIYLHDLQQDFLRAAVTDHAAEHAAIVDAYASRYPDSQFAGEDDGYFYQNLLHHLEHAGDIERMHEILVQENPDGRNAWWEARIACGQPLGYFADVRRAWRCADALGRQSAVAANGKPDGRSVALTVRYALMSGSVRASLTAIPLTLLRRLLEEGMWTMSHALAVVEWLPRGKHRVEALTAVLPHADSSSRAALADQALRYAYDLIPDEGRAACLLELTTHVERGRQGALLDEALALVRQEPPSNRTHLLMRAWQLHPKRLDFLDEAIASVAANDLGFSRAFALQALAEFVPQEKLEALLAQARQIVEPEHRAEAILAVGTRLPSERASVLASEASGIARSLEKAYQRITLLARAGRLLASPEREQVAEEAAAALHELHSGKARVEVLLDAIPLLNGVARVRAEARLDEECSAGGTADLRRGGRGEWLAQVAPEVLKPFVERQVAAAARSDNEHSRARAIDDSAPYLDREQVRQLLEEELQRAQMVGDLDHRINCLAAIAARLRDAWRHDVVQDALDAVAHRPPHGGLASALAKLAQSATPEQLAGLTALVPSDASDFEKGELAAGVAGEFARRGDWERSLDSLEVLEDAYWLGRALEEFPADVPSQTAERIIDGAIETRDAEFAGQAITRLARHLPADERSAALEIGLQAADAIDNGHDRLELLKRLVPLLPCDRLRGARSLITEDAARQDELEYAAFLGELAVRLASCGEVLSATEVLGELRHAHVVTRAAAEMAALVREPLREKLFEWSEVAADRERDATRVEALVYLARCRQEPHRSRLVAKAIVVAERIVETEGDRRIISAREERARALAIVAPEVDEPPRRRKLLLDAWRQAPKGGSFSGTKILATLSPHLAALTTSDLYGPWQADLEAASSRAAAVLDETAALVDVISRLGGEEALCRIAHAVRDVGRWWP